jgi:hypothetical protein
MSSGLNSELAVSVVIVAQYAAPLLAGIGLARLAVFCVSGTVLAER